VALTSFTLLGLLGHRQYEHEGMDRTISVDLEDRCLPMRAAQNNRSRVYPWPKAAAPRTGTLTFSNKG